MSSTLLSTNWPVARKKYRCEQCQTPIEPGTKHRKEAGIWEGGFYTNREHTDCGEASHEIWLNAGLGYDEGIWLHEEYWNEPEFTGAFLLEKYPEVAARLGVKPTSVIAPVPGDGE